MSTPRLLRITARATFTMSAVAMVHQCPQCTLPACDDIRWRRRFDHRDISSGSET
jgi:hypothetical protein